MAPIHNLAIIIKHPKNEDQFLLLKQTPPPKFNHEEYDSYIDSDLYDLPSSQLDLLDGDQKFPLAVQAPESLSGKIDLEKFNLESAIAKVVSQLGLRASEELKWSFWKYVEEAEFGPGPPVQTVFITGKLVSEDETLGGELCKWMSVQDCLNCFREVKPGNDRIGPLAVAGLVNDSKQAVRSSIPSSLRYQEYPPGVVLVPMGSRTGKPFRTTNLIIIAPETGLDCSKVNNYVAHGDALIVDPGCSSAFHEQLLEIVTGLPKKLVIFLTHHHRDHVDGLSVIQKGNPDVTLVAHENTMRRLGKGDWSLGHTSVSGDEEICIGSQRFSVIYAPGHTDGHMALLHVSTNSLIVGDHCVGQGSALLDITSGGNMADYFETTYKFMKQSPHDLIPMHGRVCLWPKHMLSAYLKNRRYRESEILKEIENGAVSLFDIVSTIYSDVDTTFWFHAASNVRLHVEHLEEQHKLPEAFSVQKFQATCRFHFLSRWIVAYLRSHSPLRVSKVYNKLLVALAVVGFGVLYHAVQGLS